MNLHEFIFSETVSKRLARHLIFWMVWWIYFAATYYYYLQVGQQKVTFGELESVLLVETFLLILAHMMACYIFIYFLLPRFLSNSSYVELASGIIVLVAFLLVSVFFMHAYIFPIFEPAYMDKLTAKNNNLWWVSVNSGLLNAPKIITAAAAIYLAKSWYQKDREKERIQKEKLETDLQLLKAQIHPGLLFSSLEQIYEYTKIKSPEAPRLLLKFSDLLSYLLYECNDLEIPVERELTMMREYMMLEKIRYGSTLEMEVHIQGETEQGSIAPLLLLPFIENSFRHSSLLEEQPWINLGIEVQDKILVMKIMNGINISSIESDHITHDIVNVQKRLEILYPESYELKMYAEQEIYFVILKIDLQNSLRDKQKRLLQLNSRYASS
jgi:sensor histidine kinase YesM